MRRVLFGLAVLVGTGILLFNLPANGFGSRSLWLALLGVGLSIIGVLVIRTACSVDKHDNWSATHPGH